MLNYEYTCICVKDYKCPSLIFEVYSRLNKFQINIIDLKYKKHCKNSIYLIFKIYN